MKTKITILFFALLLTVSSCKSENKSESKSSGDTKSETRNALGFSEINAGNTVHLEISAQEDFSLIIEASENLLPEVKTEVKGETLVISTKDIKSSQSKINVKISLPELKKLEIWGASSAVVNNIKIDFLDIRASGTSNITIDGQTKSLKSSAIGASIIDAEDLKTESAEATTTGSSNITVFVTGDLTAEAMGASNIFYLGAPKSIKQNLIGTSTVQKK